MGPDSLYCGKYRKISKSLPDLDIGPTMPNKLFSYTTMYLTFMFLNQFLFELLCKHTHTHRHKHTHTHTHTNTHTHTHTHTHGNTHTETHTDAHTDSDEYSIITLSRNHCGIPLKKMQSFWGYPKAFHNYKNMLTKKMYKSTAIDFFTV